GGLPSEVSSNRCRAGSTPKLGDYGETRRNTGCAREGDRRASGVDRTRAPGLRARPRAHRRQEECPLMHVRTPSRPAWLSLPLRRMRIVLALIAVLALLLTAVQATVARAAGAPPSGTYSGTSTAYTGATVELEIDEAGRLVEFDTESYIEFGLYPTAMQWAGVPATPVTADEPFDLTWQFSGCRRDVPPRGRRHRVGRHVDGRGLRL